VVVASTTTGGRGRLGAGLVAVAPVPLRDPARAVLSDPQVPEGQRFCATCGSPVGRSAQGRPGRVEGFCPKDRTPFSFVPHLRPGDLVDHRYEILGALAHGGLGWIYLARDRNISESGADRWVVLKGLINTGDAEAMAAAVAERRFLVEVDHPSIVKVYDFAQHPDPNTGERVGYIVMEYVGGRSLRDLLLSHTGPDGHRTPLPLEEVLAYGIEILPALGYLHGRGLLFCDFKPDNVIHAEEQLKLIDLGAVRRITDQASALWGTPGYQAPELAERGASVASDLYTVGRTLAVLSFDFGGFSTTYEDRLPHPGDVPLFAQEESYHRLLLRATDAEPSRRFSSAAEFAEQATGVLREVLSAADEQPRPSGSSHFSPPRRAFGTETIVAGDPPLQGPQVAAALPVPLADPTDPAAGTLAALGGGDPGEALSALSTMDSVEARLGVVRALIETGNLEGAAGELADRSALLRGNWRGRWYAGVIALVRGAYADAVGAFDDVYSALPGEPAVRLALAAAAELAGDADAAERRYLRVWLVDRGMVSAAFGLARVLLAAGDRDGAVAVLDEVPDSSSQYLAAQIAAIRATLDTGAGPVEEGELVAASDRLERLRLDPAREAILRVEMLRTALTNVMVANLPARETATAGSAGSPDPRAMRWGEVVQDFLRRDRTPVVAPVAMFLGGPIRERDLRLGLERAYRLLASHESDRQVRYALVDQANAVRPRTVL
jgi:serine/threonine-protein kinase PknG